MKAKAISIHSSRGGTGKTIIAINLAMDMTLNRGEESAFVRNHKHEINSELGKKYFLSTATPAPKTIHIGKINMIILALLYLPKRIGFSINL